MTLRRWTAATRAANRVAEWIRVAIWVVGTVFFVFVTTLAAQEVANTVSLAHDEAGIWSVVISLGVMTGIAGLALLAIGRLGSRALAGGLLLIALSRLGAIAMLQSPLVSDFANYHQLAIGVARDGPHWSAIPVGWPTLLGSVYAVFGPNPVVGELLNLAIAVLTGWLIYDLGLRVFGRASAAFGLWLFALAPAQTLWVVVLGGESLYGLLLVAACWVLSRLTTTPMTSVAISGVLLGMAQYVRATTPVIVAGFLVGIVLWFPPVRRVGRLAATLAAAFLITLSPVIAHNLQAGAGLSVSTSQYGGWSLLTGTDGGRVGAYNSALAAAVGGTPGTPSFDGRAFDIALKRMLEHPGRVASLAVRKVPLMWANEGYAILWVTRGYGEDLNHPAPAVGLMVSQTAYLGTLALVTLGLFQNRRSRPSMALLMLLIIISVAGIHLLLEVQPRYHAYLEPFFFVFAGAGLTGILRRVGWTWTGAGALTAEG